MGFVLEQTLGHVTHGRNLRASLEDAPSADVEFRDLDFAPRQRRDRLPPWSNWTVRAGLAARAAVADMERAGRLDGLFVHTFVPAVALHSVMDRIPTVVSIDSTPMQMDELGRSYGHDVRARPVEAVKWRMHRRTFQKATSLVAWSEWAADGLVEQYGVERRRIAVIPPGVRLDAWRRPEPRPSGPADVVRILFVGGDFERKGGPLLVEALRRLETDEAVRRSGVGLELHLVTAATLPSSPGIVVHNGLTPNSPDLIDLFHRCDVFALPTRGDCSPLVLAEAAAAGLATVTTPTGAIGETVLDDVTGHLVAPDVEQLLPALRRLVLDHEHRHRLGRAATAHAERTMDAEANAHRVLEQVVRATRATDAPRVCLTVSGQIDDAVRQAAAAGERPIADYLAIADRADADLIDRDVVRREGSTLTKLLVRAAGDDVGMAHHLFRRRGDFDVVITDGEQIGIPLAAMLRIGGRRHLRHAMIAHRLSVARKTVPIRALGLSREIDDVLVYSTSQLRVAEALFRRPDQRVHRIDFMVDTEFFRPRAEARASSRPLVSSAGREFRDYPTLVEAVRDLDVDLVIASASPWSRREDNASVVELPDNVTVTSLSQRDLRDLFDRSDLVVVPLLPTDFQAGVTTILEAMAMERPVVCTATMGQFDVVVDGQHGRYVAPADVAAMRSAILDLLGDAERAAAMGRAGRRLVVERADVRTYADIVTEIALHGSAGPHRSEDVYV